MSDDQPTYYVCSHSGCGEPALGRIGRCKEHLHDAGDEPNSNTAKRLTEDYIRRSYVQRFKCN